MDQGNGHLYLLKVTTECHQCSFSCFALNVMTLFGFWPLTMVILPFVCHRVFIHEGKLVKPYFRKIHESLADLTPMATCPLHHTVLVVVINTHSEQCGEDWHLPSSTQYNSL